MLSQLETFFQISMQEGLVRALLGAESVIVVTVALTALGARLKGPLVIHRHQAAYRRFFEAYGHAASRVEDLLLLLPDTPVGGISAGEPPVAAIL
jgi:hypothetical protein